MLLTTVGYIISFLAFNKQLNCTCCVKLFLAEGYNIVSRHIQLVFDYWRSESWVMGIYYIYEEFLTTTWVNIINMIQDRNKKDDLVTFKNIYESWNLEIGSSRYLWVFRGKSNNIRMETFYELYNFETFY